METPEDLGAEAERSVPATDAIRIAQNEIARLGRSVTFDWLEEGNYRICAAALLSNDSRVVARSAGKGRGVQAMASAMFEALEHFHMLGSHNSASRREARLLPLDNVRAQDALVKDALISRMARVGGGLPVACSPYRDMSASEEIWYQTAIADIGYRHQPEVGDAFDYGPFLKYCSTSGLAAGVSETDALLHAALELVERDAVSLALIDWFLARQGSIRLVDRATLTRSARDLLELAEHATGAEIAICDVTSDIPISAYLAFPKQPRYGSNTAGSGSSLNSSYAVERAIGEVLQEARLIDHYGTANMKQRQAERLSAWPDLRACAQLSLEHICDNVGVAPMAMRDDRGPAGALEALRLVIEALSSAGYTLYWRTISPDRSHVAVVHALVPGLENFALVRTGHPLAPVGRGALGSAA